LALNSALTMFGFSAVLRVVLLQCSCSLRAIKAEKKIAISHLARVLIVVLEKDFG